MEDFNINDCVEFSLSFSEEEYCVCGYVCGEQDGCILVIHEDVFMGINIVSKFNSNELSHISMFKMHDPYKGKAKEFTGPTEEDKRTYFQSLQ